MLTNFFHQDLHKKQRVSILLLILLAVLSIIFVYIAPVKVIAATPHSPISALITNGGYLLRSDKKTISYREHDSFLPASTLKLFTTLAAFNLLTPAFRFETHFHLDKKQNLYIKGYGDPFLTSEEIFKICSFLKTKGVNKVHNVILDNSAFSLQNYTPGTTNSNNPYDAPNGALAVNFNTLAIHKHADGRIVSAEPQTPTLPIMHLLGDNLPQGIQRINIKKDNDIGLISLQLQYVGELFRAQMKKAAITVNGGIECNSVPASLPPLYIHKNSKTLYEVMKECLHFSNNFIANQVFLYLGLQTSGAPATWEKSRHFLHDFLTKTLSLSPQSISVQDGSGLSRNNRITADALVTILDHFRPYVNLLNEHEGAILKSGTLHDVYCYGGYLTGHDELIPFAILLNQKSNTRDTLLKELSSLYKSHP